MMKMTDKRTGLTLAYKTKKLGRQTKDFSGVFSEIDLPLHGVRLPEFKILNKYKRKFKLSEDVDNYDFLRGICKTGFYGLELEKGSEKYNQYVERVRYELEVLKDLGFIDYILLVWNVVNFCKENEIPTGLGRGSAAGSLVLFLIGATGIDPIKNSLYFERFISKTRAKKQVIDGVTYLDGSLMCDVDIDVCYHRRCEVLEYLDSLFEKRTSKILTFNTLSGKLLIKECGKIVSEKTEQEMNEISSLIPKVYGQVKDLKEAYDEVSSFQEWCEENKETYNIALSLRGLVKNKGVHPSAISLSYDLMNESCPTELSSDKSSVSSFDMNWVSVFNVKLDVLGLRSASVAYDVCKQIGIKPEDIDLDDPAIYRNLQDLRTPHGLFQIEADTNYRVCQKVKPKNLDELSAVLALARPGALAFVDQYADYVNNEVYEPIHPFFDDILATTGGVALYQEQLMQMAHKVGFTLDEAEILRRIVGKKKTSEVRKWRKKIREKVQKNGLDPEIGKVLWKILEDSANYSFNKSHSISYASLAAITAYLKFNHPQQFFLSLLKMSRYEPDPIDEISKIHKELQYFDIELLPPHITKSEMDFSTEDNNIRFGLLSIKGISDKSIEKILSFRKKYADKFEIFQGSEESKLGVGILSALIQAGALEGFNQSRSKLVLEAQLWNILTVREKRHCMNFAKEFNYDLIKIMKHLREFNDENGKQVIKDSRYETIKKKYIPCLEIYKQNSKSEDLANWYYEKSLLGYTYNKTLKDIYSDKRDDLSYVNHIQDLPENSRVTFIGTVRDTYSGYSKNKNKYFRCEIADETGFMTALVFKDKIDECKNLNDSKLPQKTNIVIVRGIRKSDCVFANLIAVQDQKIYTKLSQLKNLDKS
jgi:DNA polymerase-3 subunit alpha